MAAVVAPVLKHKDTHYRVYEWAGLANGDSGSPIPLGDFDDLTFWAYGTFSSGGEVTMMGAVNLPGETVDAGAPLEEEAGTDMILTEADPRATSRNAPLQAWPDVTGGDGSTDLTIRAVIRR